MTKRSARERRSGSPPLGAGLVAWATRNLDPVHRAAEDIRALLRDAESGTLPDALVRLERAERALRGVPLAEGKEARWALAVRVCGAFVGRIGALDEPDEQRSHLRLLLAVLAAELGVPRLAVATDDEVEADRRFVCRSRAVKHADTRLAARLLQRSGDPELAPRHPKVKDYTARRLRTAKAKDRARVDRERASKGTLQAPSTGRDIAPTLERMTSAERALRSLAALHGFASLRALAHAAGVDRHTLSLVAAGRRAPRRRTLQRLALALDVGEGVIGGVFATADADEAGAAG